MPYRHPFGKSRPQLIRSGRRFAQGFPKKIAIFTGEKIVVPKIIHQPSHRLRRRTVKTLRLETAVHPLRRLKVEAADGQRIQITLQRPDTADLPNQAVAGAIIALRHCVTQQLSHRKPSSRRMLVAQRRPCIRPQIVGRHFQRHRKRQPQRIEPCQHGQRQRKFERAHRRHRPIAVQRDDYSALAHHGDPHLGLDTAHGTT